MESPTDTGAAALLELVPAAAAEAAAVRAGLPPGWGGVLALVLVLVLRTSIAWLPAFGRAVLLMLPRGAPEQGSRVELDQAGTPDVRAVVAALRRLAPSGPLPRAPPQRLPRLLE